MSGYVFSATSGRFGKLVPTSDAASNTLLPCPKCEGAGHLRMSSDGDAEWVECSACGYNGGVALTAALAVKSWNTHPYADRAGGEGKTEASSSCPICEQETPHKQSPEAVKAWRSTTEARARQAFADGAFAVGGAYNLDDPAVEYVIKQAFHPEDYVPATTPSPDASTT